MRLITDAQRTALLATGSERAAAYGSLCALYRIASLELRKHGDWDSARIGVDRALFAAEQADDLNLVGAAAATMTVQIMIQGRPDDAICLALDTVGLVGREPAISPADLVVRGALYLYGAQAAARAQDAREAHRLLRLAADLAARLGHDREDHQLIFGPTNVAIQEVGILVDLDSPAEALRRAATVRPDCLRSVNRSAYHHLHIARARAMRGRPETAVGAVETAYRIAPDLVANDPIAVELVRDAVHRQRAIGEQLRGLAERMGALR